MANPYAVKTLKMVSGERLPLLIDRATGSPLFAPTVFSLTQLRGRNRAANTIELALRQVMVFLLFLEQRGINLESRFSEGRILELGEVEELAKHCSLHMEELVPDELGKWKPSRVTPIKQRPKAKKGFKSVESSSAGNRIRGIAAYISWLAMGYLLKLPAESSQFQALETTRQMVLTALRARAPEDRNRNFVGAREGLAPAAAARMLAVTSRTSTENPWSGAFTKLRNELIFRWLYAFGIRRGELLNIKISDINFREETVTIVRRADAIEDPRTMQPNVKTRDRVFPIPPDLSRLTHDYVIQARRNLIGSRKHEYLLVAARTGEPLSLSALNKCFSFLREQIPDLPDDLTPHVLRHTWNDNFSAAMDRRKTSEADEQKMRSFLMGWSETSGTAATYTRRHVRQKANEASLMLQSELTKNNKI